MIKKLQNYVILKTYKEGIKNTKNTHEPPPTLINIPNQLITSPPPPFTLWISLSWIVLKKKVTTFQSGLSHKENGLQDQFKNPSKEFILIYQSHFLKAGRHGNATLMWYTAYMYYIVPHRYVQLLHDESF